MHRVIAALLFAVSLPLAAQVGPPPKLEPVPEAPPQVGLETDPNAPGPVLTPPGSTVEEHLMPDGTRYIIVTDPNGWQYHLVEAEPGAARRCAHRDRRPHRRPCADVEDPLVVNAGAGCPSTPRSPKPSSPTG